MAGDRRPPSSCSGGYFTNAGGTPVSSIARWNGVSWQPIGSGYPGVVRALAVWNGQLYAGGTTGLQWWDGTAWQLAPTVYGFIHALAVYDGELIAGGAFAIEGVGGLNLARWDGANWLSIGAGAQGGNVNALLVDGGSLVTAGAFNVVNGVAATRVARWDGVTRQSMGAGLSDEVRALTTYNGEVVAGGGFSASGFVPVQQVARFDGANWQPLSSGLGSGSGVHALAAYGAGLVAAGEFSHIVSPPIFADRVAVWNGAQWQPLQPGINGLIQRMAVYGGNLVAAGGFTAIGGQSMVGIASFDGTNWSPLGNAFEFMGCAGCSGVVNDLLVDGSDLVVGGFFGTVGGPANRIARWDGSTWHAYGTGMSHWVNALAVYNGDLIAGGAFTSAGGTPCAFIARWDGSAWHPIGGGFNGQITSLAVYNGELFAGGPFSLAGGNSANQIARWNGVTWQPLGAGVSGIVRRMIVYESDLVVGGSFDFVGGSISSTGVARWDGAVWHAMGNVGNSGVDSFAIYNADLYAGADAWALPSGFTKGIARWDGTTWQPVGGGLNHSAFDLEVFRGELLAGGNFTAVDGAPGAYFAKLTLPVPQLAIGQPGGPATDLYLVNSGLIAGHEYYNVFSFDLAPNGAGSGIWAGLHFIDPNFLFGQVALPLGLPPFHFLATGREQGHGPYTAPPGISFEVLSGDATGGVIGCLSSVARYTTQ
jgi:hypothetical protein